MKNQLLILTAIATIILLGASVSTFAQTGSGAKYGSRDARTCADTKAPTSGAMTTALATKYVICSQEHIQGDYLYLVEDLTVQVGGAVPYNPNRFPFTADIDTKAPVYPLRADFKQYQCSKVSDISQNKGYNCNIYNRPKATGVCVKTTFGDWRCSITSADLDTSKSEANMPPPKGNAKTTANDKDTPTTTKNNQPKAGTKDNADENKDESGLPKPDFSDIEKYFDISKIEYNTADRTLNFIGKMTKQVNANEFVINFYDEDGIKVIPEGRYGWKGSIFDPVGTPSKFSFNLPPESKWKFVKKVAITRFKP